MWIALMAMGCGQFVSAEDALSAAGTVAGDPVDLPGRDELVDATTLNYYGLDGLLALHTDTEEWSGGTMRVVDYTTVGGHLEAGVTLAEGLSTMAALDPTGLESQEEKIAFYLNLYNLWAIQYVVDHLEDPDFEGAATDDFVAFRTDMVQVAGLTLTLNGLEHGLVRGDPYAFADDSWSFYFSDEATRDAAWELHEDLWGGDVVDARVHMAFNCFSRSCPDIAASAYRAASLDADLDAQSTAFLAHPSKGAGPDGISTLFSWYAADFEAWSGSSEAFIEEHREGGLDGVDTSVFLDYDWALNGS